MNKTPTWRQRLSYYFDNALSKGPLVLIGWLAVAALILVVLATVVSLLIPGVAPDGTGLKEVFWDFLFQALTPNPFDVTSPLPFLFIMLIVTLGSLFMVSILIGTLTTGIGERLEQMRRGHSQVLESDHTIILGWSHQVFTIVEEIVSANENRKNGAVIAIMADRDKVDMENDLRNRVPNTKNTRVICRSGLPIDPTQLEIVSPHTARAIIILPPEESDPDSSVIKTVLALTNNPKRRPEPYHIVTQISNPRHLNIIKMLGTRDDMQAVLTGDVIARVAAQTSRQSGLSIVYTELLNFSGDEIYFQRLPSLSGKSFGDALNVCEDSSIIGLHRADGSISLNPPMDTRLSPEDEVIAISADDDTVKLSGLSSYPIQTALIRSGAKRESLPPEKCLILGWNDSAPIIVRELDQYVPAGSTISVVADPGFEEQITQSTATRNQKINFRGGDTTDRDLLDDIRVAEFDHVLVLADDRLGTQASDARTLLSLLHLRDMAEKDATPFSIVSEMLDLRNRELAEVARVDDFIVSDHLISLMMAQLSENGALINVFDELFDPQGSEIYLKPANEYVEIGQPVNFYTVIEAARQRGEVAIGYRIASELHDAAKSYGVRTNPRKSVEVTFSIHDRIIVLTEE